MRVVAIVVGYLIGAYLVIRAVVELVTIHYGDAASYDHDWGGPNLLGVLAVHCLPGIVALALMIRDIRRRRRSTG
jgi:hypothetical protein